MLIQLQLHNMLQNILLQILLEIIPKKQILIYYNYTIYYRICYYKFYYKPFQKNKCYNYVKYYYYMFQLHILIIKYFPNFIRNHSKRTNVNMLQLYDILLFYVSITHCYN